MMKILPNLLPSRALHSLSIDSPIVTAFPESSPLFLASQAHKEIHHGEKWHHDNLIVDVPI